MPEWPREITLAEAIACAFLGIGRDALPNFQFERRLTIMPVDAYVQLETRIHHQQIIFCSQRHAIVYVPIFLSSVQAAHTVTLEAY